MSLRTVLPIVGIGLAGLVGVMALQQLGQLEGAELSLYDTYSRNALKSTAASDEIIILQLTESDIRAAGHWPLSDRELSSALTKLLDAGAQIVGLDIYRDLPVPPGEQQLSRLLRSREEIITVHKFGPIDRDGIAGPWPLQENPSPSREGFNDVIPDRDDRIRRSLLFLDEGEDSPVEYSFALRVALAALSREDIWPTVASQHPGHPDWMQLGAAILAPLEQGDGGYRAADVRGYQVLPDFSATRAGFRRFDFSSLIAGEIDPELIRDRIVMVGATAHSLRDFFRVPGSSPSEQVSGIEIHSHFVQQLLDWARGRGAPIHALQKEWQIVLLCLIAGLGSGFGLMTSRLGMGLAAIAASAVVGASTLFLVGFHAYLSGIWIPVAAPIVAWCGTAIVSAAWFARQRDQEAAAAERAAARRPARLETSVLALQLECDSLANSTADPERLSAWLSTLVARIGHLVAKHGGEATTRMGDNLLASFGASRKDPVSAANDVRRASRCALGAERAVSCALDMAAALAVANEELAGEGLPTATLRIGVSSGWAVETPVDTTAGEAARAAATPAHALIGSEVTTAKLLGSSGLVEHDFGQAPCRLLVSDSTRRYLGDKFSTCHLGEVTLRQGYTLDVHRVLGRTRCT